jgi:hypothetical protein
MMGVEKQNILQSPFHVSHSADCSFAQRKNEYQPVIEPGNIEPVMGKERHTNLAYFLSNNKCETDKEWMAH